MAGRGSRSSPTWSSQTPGWHMRGRMQRFTSFTSFTTGRRNPRAPRVAFGVAAAGAAMLLAACSSSSSSSSSTTTPASTGASSSSSASGSADLTALQADVAKAAATPNFSAYLSNYGGKIPSIANLAGKKIMIIPGVSALAACRRSRRPPRTSPRPLAWCRRSSITRAHRPSTTPRSRTRSTRATRRSSWAARWTRRRTRPRSPRRRRPASWWASTAEPRTGPAGQHHLQHR